MILLASSNFLVTGPGGQAQSLDFERLAADLRAAFRAHGTGSDWIAEHIVLTLEEKLRSRGDGQPVTEAGAHQLLTAMLAAIGYGEVAAEYGRRHQVDPLSGHRRELHVWTADGMRELLDRTLPLTTGQSERLARRCAAVLRQLGFQEVTDTFVCELAVHLLHRGEETAPAASGRPFFSSPLLPGEAEPLAVRPESVGADDPPGSAGASASPGSQAEPSPPPPALLLPEVVWLDRVDDLTRSLLATRVLRPLPVSRLFPRLGLAVSLPALGETLTGGWPSPLTILTALGRISPPALTLLALMRQEYAAALTAFQDAPCRLVLPEFTSYLAEGLGPMTRRERAQLTREINGLLEESLVGKADFPIMLCFR